MQVRALLCCLTAVSAAGLALWTQQRAPWQEQTRQSAQDCSHVGVSMRRGRRARVISACWSRSCCLTCMCTFPHGQHQRCTVLMLADGRQGGVRSSHTCERPALQVCVMVSLHVISHATALRCLHFLQPAQNKFNAAHQSTCTCSFYSVLDGHEGESAADYVAQHLPDAVVQHLASLARCGMAISCCVWLERCSYVSTATSDVNRRPVCHDAGHRPRQRRRL
jgi:hypothetical protein